MSELEDKVRKGFRKGLIPIVIAGVIYFVTACKFGPGPLPDSHEILSMTPDVTSALVNDPVEYSIEHLIAEADTLVFDPDGES